jgi:hypothetical protein
VNTPDDMPDPKLFWRWVGKATRPVVGWILVAVGAVMIIVGYLGVAHQVLVAKQLPYLVSGGILGVAVVAVGVMFIATEQLRHDADRLDRLERLVDDLHEVLLSHPDAPAPAEAVTSPVALAALVALPEGERYHTERCRVVQGKQDVEPVTPRAIRRRALTPCPLCEPTAVSG